MKKIHTLWFCAFLLTCGGCANQQTSQKMEEEEPSSQEVTEMEEDTAALQTVSEKDEIWYDGEIPFVLRKRIYAVASIIGGIIYYILYTKIQMDIMAAAFTGIAAVFGLRMMATIFKWNLPKAFY